MHSNVYANEFDCHTVSEIQTGASGVVQISGLHGNLQRHHSAHEILESATQREYAMIAANYFETAPYLHPAA